MVAQPCVRDHGCADAVLGPEKRRQNDKTLHRRRTFPPGVEMVAYRDEAMDGPYDINDVTMRAAPTALCEAAESNTTKYNANTYNILEGTKGCARRRRRR